MAGEPWFCQVRLIGKGPGEAAQWLDYNWAGVPKDEYEKIVGDLARIGERLKTYQIDK